MVTRPGGRLAVGRLGVLCEPVNVERRKEYSGKDGILMSHCCSISVGRGCVCLMKLLISFERIGCLQLKELNSQGYEIVLVTSGAVGLGRQRFR